MSDELNKKEPDLEAETENETTRLKMDAALSEEEAASSKTACISDEQGKEAADPEQGEGTVGSEPGKKDERIRPGVDVAPSGEESATSASVRSKLKRLAVPALACVVVLCAVIAGVGYAAGWFDGGELAAQDQEVIEQVDASDEDAADEGAEEDATAESDAAVDAGALEAGESSEGAEGSESGGPSGDGILSSSSTESSFPTASSGSGSSSGSSSSGSSSSSSGSSGSSSSSSSGTTSQSTITVTVSIDSSRAVFYGYSSSLGGGTVTVAQGCSVYDALVATGVAVRGSSSYVSSIGGLAEFACGSGSGWLYFVNGVSPSCSCRSYILSGGETITWVYTCDMGNDL